MLISSSANSTIFSHDVSEKPFDWPLFGVVIGLLFLAALAICCCFCWCYLWFVSSRLKLSCIRVISFGSSRPLVAVGSQYRNDNKPVLYHIEPCFDPECRGWDRSSPSDIPLGHYMNLERVLSMSMSRRDWSSFVSSRTDSHVPLVHASVSRVSMIEREGTFGNARIKPPMREVINKQNNISHRRRVNTGVIVSRIRSYHNQKMSPDISRDHFSTGEYPPIRDHVKVIRVHSAWLDTPRQSILNQPLQYTFTDNEESKAILSLSINSGHSSHFDYLLSSKRISAKNSIRVDRISRRKEKDKRQHSNSLSSITTSKQKRKTNRHGATRVKRISRTKTA